MSGIGRRVQKLLLGVLGVALPVEAYAAPMDFALERLVTAKTAACRNDDGTLGTGFCETDNVAFKQLMSQYGMAIAPSAAYSAKTTGYAGFEILAELTVTGIDSKSNAVIRGTRGPTDQDAGSPPGTNTAPAGALPMYSLRLRKGFGFGFEVGTTFGVLGDTSIISGGADLRLSLLEGFRKGIPGYFPDIAATGGVRSITGTSQAQMTVASVQGTVSKGIVLGKTGELTPWVAYQYLWIFGDSGIIDMTPLTNPQDYCGYVGPNIPGTPVSPSGPRDGSPVCNGGSADEFNNNRVFQQARIQRHRLNLGVSYQYDVLMVGGQFGLDLGSPNNDADLAGEMKQWSFTLQAGALF
jgi:hypothetical protein